MKFFIIAIVSLMLFACHQMPSETRVVSDNSAGLSFSFSVDAPGNDYQIFVDGFSMGNVKQFLKGQNILKIVSGSHIIRIEKNGREVLKEKIYVSAGTNKVLVVSQ